MSEISGSVPHSNGHLNDPYLRPVVLFLRDSIVKLLEVKPPGVSNYAARQALVGKSALSALLPAPPDSSMTEQQMELFCQNEILEGQGDFQKSYQNAEGVQVQRFIFASLAICSIIGLTTVALTIFYNKKLSQAPSPLIARICLVEAIMCWNSLLRFLEPTNAICYFGLYKLFSLSTL